MDKEPIQCFDSNDNPGTLMIVSTMMTSSSEGSPKKPGIIIHNLEGRSPQQCLETPRAGVEEKINSNTLTTLVS